MSIMALIMELGARTEGNLELDCRIYARAKSAIVKPYPASNDFGPKDKFQFWSVDGEHFLGNEASWKVKPITTHVHATIEFIHEFLPGWRIDLRTKDSTATEYNPARYDSAGLTPFLRNDQGWMIGCKSYSGNTLPLALCRCYLAVLVDVNKRKGDDYGTQ